jgi:hypothetical protein
VVGIVFPSVSLAAAEAATLHDCHMVFDIDEVHPSSQQPVTVRIFGELSATPALPSSTAYDLTSRTRTSATVTWSIPSTPTVHGLLRSPDVSSIVSEIISLPGWASGNSIALMIEHVSGAGDRWVESYATNSAFATASGTNGATPALEVNGQALPPPPPPPSPPPVGSYQVFAISDHSHQEAEEHVLDNGRMYLGSSDLEVRMRGHPRGTRKLVVAQLRA